MSGSVYSVAAISRAIALTYKSKRFWDAMVEQSTFRSGPFDGGCYVVASALIAAVGAGDLVYLASSLNSGQVEHFGVRIDGVYYDFSGPARSPYEWIERLRQDEFIYDRDLFFDEIEGKYIDNVPRDPETSRKVTHLLKMRLAKAMGI